MVVIDCDCDCDRLTEILRFGNHYLFHTIQKRDFLTVIIICSLLFCCWWCVRETRRFFTLQKHWVQRGVRYASRIRQTCQQFKIRSNTKDSTRVNALYWFYGLLEIIKAFGESSSTSHKTPHTINPTTQFFIDHDRHQKEKIEKINKANHPIFSFLLLQESDWYRLSKDHYHHYHHPHHPRWNQSFTSPRVSPSPSSGIRHQRAVAVAAALHKTMTNHRLATSCSPPRTNITTPPLGACTIASSSIGGNNRVTATKTATALSPSLPPTATTTRLIPKWGNDKYRCKTTRQVVVLTESFP